ncbi:hypothetical protein ODJ79_35015 [Actinoplanes sp. KI2]|uniref:sigma factor n=1 Tax=Actinoplanes sp. KI2 TaxID=2983315 RepID=UPI0021D5CE80|nr:sigma factor [Actinoplanes sp. KI2]MCU7728952.1 hypothetical protein [Actinoplanes sp. KI2]
MDDDQEHDYLAYAGGRVPALRRLAILSCGDDDRADDLVQETITKLYAVWPRAGKVENLDAYPHAMLVRAFLDDRRRGWWKVRLFDAVPEPPAFTVGRVWVFLVAPNGWCSVAGPGTPRAFWGPGCGPRVSSRTGRR